METRIQIKRANGTVTCKIR